MNNKIPTFQTVNFKNQETPVVIRFEYKGHEISISNLHAPAELVIFREGENEIDPTFGQKVPSIESIMEAVKYIDSL